MTTASAPVSRPSHIAAILVPFPENSASDPSGFQIATSAAAPSALKTSTTPSAPIP